jgi:hypothetical protein
MIDRMGRPAINTALIGFPEADEGRNAKRNAYNATAQADWATDWSPEIAANLAILDSLDTVCGNQPLFDAAPGGYGLLAAILADDQLYVNTAAETYNGVYLGVEVNAGGVFANADMGGRTLSADVIATSYTALAAGLLDGSIDDGVTVDSLANHTEAFPFIGPPHPAD